MNGDGSLWFAPFAFIVLGCLATGIVLLVQRAGRSIAAFLTRHPALDERLSVTIPGFVLLYLGVGLVIVAAWLMFTGSIGVGLLLLVGGVALVKIPELLDDQYRQRHRDEDHESYTSCFDTLYYDYEGDEDRLERLLGC